MKEKNLIETAKMQGNMMVSGTYLLPDVCVSEPTESDFLWITDLLFGVVCFFSLTRKRKNSVYFTKKYRGTYSHDILWLMIG